MHKEECTAQDGIDAPWAPSLSGVVAGGFSQVLLPPEVPVVICRWPRRGRGSLLMLSRIGLPCPKQA